MPCEQNRTMLARSRSTRMFVSGTDLYWEDWGRRTGGDASAQRPLVLLHGLSDSGGTFNRVVRIFAQRRRVIVPDLPGHGRSGRPSASYDLDWYASVMRRWIEELDLGEFDLLGHSLGGGIAQRLLLEPIGPVRRLSLVSTGGFGAQVAWPIRLAAMPGVLERIGQPLMAAGTALGVRLCGGKFSRRDRDHLCHTNSRPGSARALGRTIRSVVSVRAGQRQHFLDHAHEVPHLPPLSVFWGERDPIIPSSHADTISQWFEGVTVTRFRCGHYPHRELPLAFASAVERFLDTPQPTPVLRRVPHRSSLRGGHRRPGVARVPALPHAPSRLRTGTDHHENSPLPAHDPADPASE